MLNQILIEKIDSEDFFSRFRQIIKEEIAEMQQDSTIKESELKTRKQTKELLDTSYVSLNKWTAEGKLQSYNIGGKVFYRYSEILQALRKNKRRR